MDVAISFESWIKTLPASQMVRPEAIIDRAKYAFWRFYTPYHAAVRDTLLSVGVVSHEGRQNFLLGHLAPGKKIKDFTSFLIERGYGNHFIAWKDDGEVVGLRYVENFVYQYHIRIFKDGEVRGHYEYTPECHPWWHYKAFGQVSRRDEFLDFLSDWIVPSKG